MFRLLRYLISVLLITLAAAAYSVDLKSTTVAGFINKGAAKDANVNIQMTKSMTAFLAKLSKNVASYKDASGAAEDQGFWKKTKFESADAIAVAQSLGTEQVISGDYKVDGDKIVIHVSVYDVVTGKLKLERGYDGGAGMDLFDTIDKMIKDVSGLLIGRTVDMGKFKIGVIPEGKTYKLYINGTYVKPISKKAGYEETYLAGQKIEVMLKEPDNDAEIYRSYFDIIKGKTTEYKYSPVGTVVVKVMDGESDVFINDKLYGRTDKTGTITITNIKAGEEMHITSKAVDSAKSDTVVKVSEGESKVIVLESQAHKQRLFYFPVRVGLMGGYEATAGIDFFFTPSIEAGLSGGVLANQFSTLNKTWSFLPLIELNAGYYFTFNDFLKAGLVASGVAVIGKTAVISPALALEAEIFHITVSAGARYGTSTGGIYPMIFIGYRF